MSWIFRLLDLVASGTAFTATDFGPRQDGASQLFQGSAGGAFDEGLRGARCQVPDLAASSSRLSRFSGPFDLVEVPLFNTQVHRDKELGPHRTLERPALRNGATHLF